MMSKIEMLKIENLTIRLPKHGERKFGVQGLSLTLHRNEILCIVGESGSGKSLTARAIMRLLPEPYVYVSDGDIRLEQEKILSASSDRIREIRGNLISMIFQEPMTALNPVMTIGNQIDEVLFVHTNLKRAERQERIFNVLEEVLLPSPMKIVNSFPHQLSGGQRQRAMIAMAIILQPRVLIADEPTTALDVTTEAQVLKLIRDLQKKHQTGVLFITHNFGVVAEIADRVAVMQNGVLVELDQAECVLNTPRHPYTRLLINAVPSIIPEQKMIRHFGATVLATHRLNKVFKTSGGLTGKRLRMVHAAKNIELCLQKGETLGLVGESGSGKSTVARCIIGLTQADEGEILLDGIDLGLSPRRRSKSNRKRIQMIFQDPYGSLNPRYKVRRLIVEGQIVHGVPPRIAIERAVDLLNLVGMDERALDRYPHEFSGGQRQRIAIARALSLDPDILIADEPVSALDVSIQDQVLELFADIRNRFSLSMLFITHDLRVAAKVCDNIAVMYKGEIVEYRPTNEIFQDPQHPYTHKLFSSVPGKDWRPPRFNVEVSAEE